MLVRHWCQFLLALSCLLVPLAAASGTPITLTSSVPTSQPVGTTIKWTATPLTGMVYQFSVAYASGQFFVVRDASSSNSFSWTPMQEGPYTVKVIVISSNYQGVPQTVTAPFKIVSRVTAGVPVISPTNNPLVALYSAPPCGTGTIFIEFGITASANYWVATNAKPCSSILSSNFYIAGMLSVAVYQMRQVVTTPTGTVIEGPVMTFTTGAVNQALPTVTLASGPTGQSSLQDRVLLHGMLNTQDLSINVPFATNLAGNVVWYFNGFSSIKTVFSYLTRPVSGGTMLILASAGKVDDFLSEVDLAGNVVRQTDLLRINAQLNSLGVEQVVALHHEAVRFPNGQTLVLGMIERPGTGGAHPILGDMIIALDQNLQVKWTWDAFDHLSTARGPILGETCLANYGAFCPASDLLAIDWLHSNSLAYSAADHNLLLSIRDQDWVIKINYQDGTGPGDVLWTLGANGTFTMQSADPYPWFSHQHDATLIGTNQVILFDNGNTRCVFQSPCHSRGQVLQLDETNHTATLVFNGDLGVYGSSLGSAQILSNGDYHFGPGYIEPTLTSSALEFTPSATVNYNMQINATEYRNFRMQSLYAPPTGQ